MCLRTWHLCLSHSSLTRNVTCCSFHYRSLPLSSVQLGKTNFLAAFPSSTSILDNMQNDLRTSKPRRVKQWDYDVHGASAGERVFLENAKTFNGGGTWAPPATLDPSARFTSGKFYATSLRSSGALARRKRVSQSATGLRRDTSLK